MHKSGGSIDSQLAAKGLKKTDGTTDLKLDYQTAITKSTKWESYEDWSSASFVDQRLGVQVKTTIEVGTLVIDMYDTAAKNLVWTGRASKTIDPKSNQEARQKSLDKAAKALLKDFPLN